ncbi:MAG: hypothetical protein E7172_04055 [Firmicutes bacterium]|nr:hypothetical protein [Bacillota bacterium]
MEKKEIKQENKELETLSNEDIIKAINNVKEELKSLKEANTKKVEVEQINDNFNLKKQYENDSINIKQINLEPFNKLNDFIFKHDGGSK